MTTYIIIITCIISFMAFQNHELMRRLLFNSAAVSERREWWRFVTSGFVHADWAHLILNMLALYSFGSAVEHGYSAFFESGSTFKFLFLYFGGMVIAMIPSYNTHRHDANYNALGASGAVSAVVFAGILFYPLADICFYFVLCLPGVVMGVAFLAISYYLSKKGVGNINHSAHLWGALFGITYTLTMKPQIFIYFIGQISAALN